MSDFNPAALPNTDTSRMRAYKDNLDFYNGNQWTSGGRERRLVFNYAKVNIDKVTSYLMTGRSLAVDPVTEDKAAHDQARADEAVLRTVYAENNLDELDFEAEVDAAVLGDGCYKVIWNAAEKRVQITAPDVTGLWAWRTGDDVNEVWRIATRYQLEKEAIASIYGKTITNAKAWLTEAWTASTLTIYLDSDVLKTGPNPYGFIPFVLFPNLKQVHEAWGVSDVPPIIETQREINRALSQLSRILELSGNPIAVLENVDASSNIQVQPGAVWNLPEDSRAYLLDLLKGGGARLHIDYIDLLYRAMHDLSESPRAAYGGITQELSGVALEVELHSLLQKVNRKRAIRSGAYKKRNEMIARLLKQYAGLDFGPVRHRTVWGAVVPQDKARMAQNEQLLVQSGVHSRKTAMDEIGVQDPDAEFVRWLEERAAIMTQNQELNARSTRGGQRERNTASETASEPLT